MYYDLDISPKIIFLKNNAIFYLGFEKHLLCIDCITNADIYNKKLIAPFYEFLETDKNIIVVCELDILSFNKKGDLI